MSAEIDDTHLTLIQGEGRPRRAGPGLSMGQRVSVGLRERQRDPWRTGPVESGAYDGGRRVSARGLALRRRGPRGQCLGLVFESV